MSSSVEARHDHAAKLPRDEHFDVAVVGAGVVGCAVARRFAIEGAKVAVLEQAADIVDGASKANSAILHTGFDAPPNSVEQSCIEAGYNEFLQIHERLGLPILTCGALVLAWNETQESALDGLIKKAHRNGVSDVEPLSRQQILEREPNLSRSVRAGFQVPREYVIDPWTTPYLYLLQAIDQGAQVFRSTSVRGGSLEADGWRLETSRGPLSCRLAINCAGLYGDLLERALLGSAEFRIRPRKGQFVVYDKAAHGLTGSILLPVPSKTTKGVVVCPTIFGNLLVGPTAEEQKSREDASVERSTLASLMEEGERILPQLKRATVTATYAGLRPASDQSDYAIEYRDDRSYCRAGGIRSTGLSSALGVASLVYEHYAHEEHRQTSKPEVSWPNALPIAEAARRDWQTPGNGGIVCHCELVSRREIEEALRGPLGVKSLAGLKRRTRATMGRCQGFYCSAEIAEMTARHFENPLAQPGRSE